MGKILCKSHKDAAKVLLFFEMNKQFMRKNFTSAQGILI